MWTCEKCGREFRNRNQDHFCGTIETIDQYIAEQPEEIQPILQQVRATIRAAAPDAIEKISWRMPTFWQPTAGSRGENLIHFAAFKHHLGLYPGDLSLNPFEDRLEGYRRTKGAIQFPYHNPIDYALIADIARWRVATVESHKTSRKNERINKMTFAGVYPLYVQKAEKKGRTKEEVDTVIGWLTGYDGPGLQAQIENEVTFETFFAQAPQMNPNAGMITGVVCGVRVETIEDPLVQKIRWLDKLVDELAKGKAMEKVLRG